MDKCFWEAITFELIVHSLVKLMSLVARDEIRRTRKAEEAEEAEEAVRAQDKYLSKQSNEWVDVSLSQKRSKCERGGDAGNNNNDHRVMRGELTQQESPERERERKEKEQQ